jgi:hypothetical protein
MHIKHIHETIEKIADCAKTEVCKGVENLDTKEMSEVAEILKELCEAEYYATITKAMGEAEYGEEYDMHGPMEERRYYRGRARDSMGRFKSRRGYDEMMDYHEMYPMEHYRDMDREYGRMYYSGSGSHDGNSMSGSMGSGTRMNESSMRDHREGRSGMSRRSYMETKEMHPGNSAEEKQAKTRELEKYMTELSSDLTEMIAGASAEEKSMLKSKMQTLLSKIQ